MGWRRVWVSARIRFEACFQRVFRGLCRLSDVSENRGSGGFAVGLTGTGGLIQSRVPVEHGSPRWVGVDIARPSAHWKVNSWVRREDVPGMVAVSKQ